MQSLFKVNYKDIRTTSLTSFWCLYCYLWTDLLHCCGISIAEFEQLIPARKEHQIIFSEYCPLLYRIQITQSKTIFPRNFWNIVVTVFGDGKIIHTIFNKNTIIFAESRYPYFFSDLSTAWKVSVFGVFLVCILPHSDWIQTKKTSNADTFHAVDPKHILKNILILAEALYF